MHYYEFINTLYEIKFIYNSPAILLCMLECNGNILSTGVGCKKRVSLYSKGITDERKGQDYHMVS